MMITELTDRQKQAIANEARKELRNREIEMAVQKVKSMTDEERAEFLKED